MPWVRLLTLLLLLTNAVIPAQAQSPSRTFESEPLPVAPTRIDPSTAAELCGDNFTRMVDNFRNVIETETWARADASCRQNHKEFRQLRGTDGMRRFTPEEALAIYRVVLKIESCAARPLSTDRASPETIRFYARYIGLFLISPTSTCFSSPSGETTPPAADTAGSL
jgi:hypothetical protein